MDQLAKLFSLLLSTERTQRETRSSVTVHLSMERQVEEKNLRRRKHFNHTIYDISIYSFQCSKIMI